MSPHALWTCKHRSAHRLSYASSAKSAILQDIPEGGILVEDKLAAAAAAAVASAAGMKPHKCEYSTRSLLNFSRLSGLPSLNLCEPNPAGSGPAQPATAESPFSVASQAAVAPPSALPITTPEDEEDEDIYSDHDDDEEEDVMSALSKLDSLLSQKMQSQTLPSEIAPASQTPAIVPAGSGGVWVVQAGADPEESQEDGGSGTGPSDKAGTQADPASDKTDDGPGSQKDQDAKQQQAASALLAKTAASVPPAITLLATPPKAEVLPSPAVSPLQGMASPQIAALQVPTSWPGAASGGSAVSTTPTTSSIAPQLAASASLSPSVPIPPRPMTAPPSRTTSKASPSHVSPTLLDVNEDQGSDVELLNPHAFALQLLKHDLRILPSYQAAEIASVDRRHQRAAAGAADLAQYGYLGFNSGRPMSAPSKKQRPQSAAHARPAAAAAGVPPTRGSSALRGGGGSGAPPQRQQQQRPAAARRMSVDSIGAEATLQVS